MNKAHTQRKTLHRSKPQVKKPPKADKADLQISKALTVAGVCKVFRDYVSAHWVMHKQAAEHFGIGPRFFSAICTGDKPPTNQMLSAIGYAKVAAYIPQSIEAKPPSFSTGRCHWKNSNASVLDALEQLEQFQCEVLGYQVPKDSQPIISIANPEPAAAEQLGVQRMWASLTLDGTLEETHYIAHVSGCLVRWSEIREIPKDDDSSCLPKPPIQYRQQDQGQQCRSDQPADADNG